MKRLLIILILGMGVVNGYSWLPSIGKKSSKETEVDSEKIKKEKIEREISRMLGDEDYYWGQGVADIAGGYTDARKQAKEDAITDLSRRISVQVTSEIKQTISNVATYDDKQYSEAERRIIEERSSFLTERVLNNIHGDKIYEDYPRKGVITYLLRISRKQYEDEVKKSLNDNKNMINGFIKTGNNDYKGGRYLNAVHNWIQAKEMIVSIFGGLPIFHDINDDGTNEEFNAYLNKRVLDVFTNAQFNLSGEEIIHYDAQGNVRVKPILVAHYIDAKGDEQPLASLPLKVNLIEGKANLPREIETGNYGQYELNISNIDASYAEIVLRVEIDTDRISKLQLFSMPVLPSINIRLERIKTMALSVTFVNGSNVSTPNSLLQSLKRSIINQGFSVTEISIRKDRLSSSDATVINNSNADYFLNVYLSVSGVHSIGGYNNAFNANCSGSIDFYRLPGIDNSVASEPVAAKKGFGASGADAGLDAYIKVVPEVEKLVETIIRKM